MVRVKYCKPDKTTLDIIRAEGNEKDNWWVWEYIWVWILSSQQWKSGYMLNKLAFKESWIHINLAIALRKKKERGRKKQEIIVTSPLPIK